MLVLGDMGEVGVHGAAFHAEVGAYARARGIDRLLALGRFLRARGRRPSATGARHFADIDALLAELPPTRWPQARHALLVKGSRFMRMERVVAALAAPDAAGLTTEPAVPQSHA